MKIKRPKLNKINKIIHEPARLYIMSNLINGKSVNASLIKVLTGLSWGNLSIQLSKLEGAGYIKISKQFKKRKPETIIIITPRGKSEYREYIKILKNIL